MIARAILILLALSLGTTANAAAKTKKKYALVYAGAGACEEGCVEGAALIAERAGLDVKLVTPRTLRKTIFKGAAVWIQPGGNAIDVANAISAEQLHLIRDFVKGGGGYMGFCAGAFLADHHVDDANTIEGLNLIPGTTHDLKIGKERAVLPINWGGAIRHIYFEDGGWFDLPADAPVRVLARFESGAAAAIEGQFGLGRFVLSFPHPEAPNTWKDTPDLEDVDGPDLDLADGMLQRALSASTTSTK